MRQLTTLPSAATAQTLADYLLTLKIDTRLMQEPDGWAVWVCDEDHLPRARQELEEFNRHPNDVRYQSAGRAAAAVRKQKEQLDNAFHRRQKRFYARMGAADRAGPWTLGMIVVCVLVLILSEGFDFGFWVRQALFIAPYRVTRVLIHSPEGESEIRELQPLGLTPVLRDGQIWRLVTPIFLHFGIWHLVFNMSWLYVLGGAIEKKRGSLRYVTLVLVLAVFSNLMQYFFGHPIWIDDKLHWLRSPNFAGMSGVVYGLFGYVWMKARFDPDMGLSISPRSILIMMAWFFFCMTPWIGYVIGSGVANVAHAAGLLAGMLIGYVPTIWLSFKSD
jgi:GlpG protein